MARVFGLLLASSCLLATARSAEEPPLVRSAKTGPWSDPVTWVGGRIPTAGDRVLVRDGHTVEYDVVSDAVIRAVHVSGTLTFSRTKSTRLDVGLIRIQSGETTEEDGFDCDAHVSDTDPGPRATLEVGSPDKPIPAGITALVRLVPIPGANKESLPAIVCCGGRMDFHGAPLSRTWVPLQSTTTAGSAAVVPTEPVTGWRPGDKVIVTATTRQNKIKKTFKPSVTDNTQTEERLVKSVDGTAIVLDKPLDFDHLGGEMPGEVVNLSRNVVVESADLACRGHTMYHRGSSGSISYAEFRHLGKDGILGRYSLHFHLAGDTMRGSSVIGASIWDSGNRWLTVHGTNFLVVRDCVGYRSKGHGFFLEDGTEVFNAFDRNLAVQALSMKPLPKQVIPFDKNDGSGFWWANCRNSFTRNVATECDEYGYFFQGAKTADFDPVLRVLFPDGTRKPVDVRTLPFVRFEENTAHCQRRHGFNLGGGVPFGKPNVNGVGPDPAHPFEIRNYHAYDVHWAIHPVSPSVRIDGLDVRHAEYGVWRPEYKDHAYRGVAMADVPDNNRYAFVTPSAPPNKNADYKAPADDAPPVTVVTHVLTKPGSRYLVRGTTTDNGVVKQVTVNGTPAQTTATNFLEWEVLLDTPSDGTVTAFAEDKAGNVEKLKHVVRIR